MPIQAQEVFLGAGRASRASRCTVSAIVMEIYGAAVGIETPTVVIQPLVIKSLALES